MAFSNKKSPSSADLVERFYSLDLVRFLAALAVVIYHYGFRGFRADNYSDVNLEPFDIVARYGYLGVDTFFVVSGFVILYTALNTNATQFLISRVSRLYPAYWACLILTSLFIIAFDDGRFSITLPQFLANLTMVSPLLGYDYVDGVYLTLLEEIKFYAIVFLLLLVGQLHRIREVLIAWSLLSLVAIFYDLPSVVRFFMIAGYSHYFIAGAAFYLLKREGPGMVNVGLILMSAAQATYYLQLKAEKLSDYFGTTVYAGVCIAIMGGVFVLFALLSANRLQAINKPQMLAFGILTYPLYLLHQNIGFIVFNRWGDEVNRWLAFAIVLVSAVLISYVIHRTIEQPSIRKFRRWLQSRTPAKLVNAHAPPQPL